QYVRIWLEGVDTSRIIFANLDLVGNRWKELGVFDDSLKPVTDSQKVRVSVINSQEDSTYRADPPPGVGEVLNRQTNLLEREQSLVFTYENIAPQNRGLLQRVLLGGVEDYSGYRNMKMLVHGDRNIGNPADNLSDSLLFFMRFSSGTQNDPNNFYEYRVLLKPGWDLENFVNLDFNRLTNLKNLLIKSPRPASVVQDTIDGNYRVRGNPNLSAVRWYVMGVENLDAARAASGEVWTDELLLTDVRRETGTAGRFHLSTQLADLGSVNFEASRQGATFRNLTGGESGTLSYNRSAATTELLSFSGSFQGHKFLPKFLGFSTLPISINWSRSRSTPRLRTGSDIVLTDEFAEAERSEQLRRGFTVSPSLRKETKNRLWNLTFNRMNGSFSYSYFRSSDPFTRLSEQRSYTAALAYDLSPKKTFGFKPLGWLPSLWLLKKVAGTQFSPLPATFTVSGDVGRTQTTTILNDALQRPTVSYIRDFRGRMAAGFRIFPNLSADYSFNTRRDIANPDNLVFSFSPKKFRLGLEVERRQDFRTSYNPGLFSFADTRLTFSSAYSEALVVGIGALGGTRRIEGSSGYGANVNFNLTRLLGQPKAASAAETARKAAEQEKKEAEKKAREEEEKKKEEEKKRAERWPLDSARIADSLARAAAEAERQKRAALDSIPAEIRFRESVGRFVPLPVPAFGFLLPRLGPPQKDSTAIATAADTAAPLAPSPAALSKTAGDSLARPAPD
ncbi:MAG: cell surface protein SprA, partial [Limisphaerales bacterium]